MTTTIGGFTVFGDIERKWLSIGGAGSFFGAPTSNETPTFDGTGRFQTFQNGCTISWHPQLGSHLVWGSIAARWRAIGSERFGYPITDESGCPDNVGRFNHFKAMQVGGQPECSIYWTPQTGAVEIYGAIREKWKSLGWETGPCHYPTAPERDQIGAGRVQRFQGGVISWTPDAGAVQRLIGGDVAHFDTGQLPSDLPLGGSSQLTIQRNGDYTLFMHAHDSGFSNIEYGLSTILLAPDGTPFLFQHTGHLEGTSGSIFSSPARNSDFSIAGHDQRLADRFNSLVDGGSYIGKLTGVDKLAQGLQNLLEKAATDLAGAAIQAVVKLV